MYVLCDQTLHLISIDVKDTELDIPSHLNPCPSYEQTIRNLNSESNELFFQIKDFPRTE